MACFRIMKSPPISSTHHYGGAMASEPLYCVHTHTWEQTRWTRVLVVNPKINGDLISNVIQLFALSAC